MDVEEVPELEEGNSTHLTEHNYSKPFDESTPKKAEEEEMDTSGSSGSPSLTNLDEGRDTFETFLLCLLRVFTRLQRESSNVATPDPVPISRTGTGNGNGDETVDISPEALNTLSSGQINSLVTSNSVNYDVIQQILLKQRQQVRSLPVATEMTESCESSGSGEMETNSSSQAQSLHITPEQLKHVQAQIHDLIRSQQIALPPDLTEDQKQQLIRTLLLRQLHMSQSPEKEEGTGSTIVGLLQREAGESQVEQGTSQAQSDIMNPVTGTNPTSTGNEESLLSPASTQTQPIPSASPTATRNYPVLVPSRPVTTFPFAPPPIPSLPKSPSQAPIPPTTSQPLAASDSPAVSASAKSSKKRRDSGGKGKKERDVEPKKPSMPYNLFFSEVYSTVLAANPLMGFSECSRIISIMWNAMGADAKKRYYEEHDRQKEDYKVAMNRKAAEMARAEVMAGAGHEDEKPRMEAAAVAVKSHKEPKDPKLCVNEGCNNMAVFAEERGNRYCSNECVVSDCRQTFQLWVAQRKIKT